MIITEQRLRSDLDLLNHGGQEAISLFLEMSALFIEAGHPDALRDWINIAAPALPERERGEVMILLIRACLHSDCPNCGAPWASEATPAARSW
jgi:hypothetical protein